MKSFWTYGALPDKATLRPFTTTKPRTYPDFNQGADGQTVSGLLGSVVLICNQAASRGPLGLETMVFERVSGSSHFFISE